MHVADRLDLLLRDSLSPVDLRIEDFSAAHAGHAGARPEGESHFHVEITAAVFAGRSRIERQRLVLAAAAPLLEGEIHALTIATWTPEERAAKGGS
jgi:BolA protein